MKMDVNVNGIQSSPTKVYSAIRGLGDQIHYRAIRTRNVWNTLSGAFLSYDQYVTDIQREYICPKCKREELLWDSAFNQDNEYLISCDYCKELTFLVEKEKYDQDKSMLAELDYHKESIDSLIKEDSIRIFIKDTALYNYRILYSRQKRTLELYFRDVKVHSIPSMPEETSIINLAYILINDWLITEKEIVGSYFDKIVD